MVSSDSFCIAPRCMQLDSDMSQTGVEFTDRGTTVVDDEAYETQAPVYSIPNERGSVATYDNSGLCFSVRQRFATPADSPLRHF